MLSTVVTSVVLLNNSQRFMPLWSSCFLGSHLCYSPLPDLQSCFFSFSLEAPQSPQPQHIRTRIYCEQNQKLSPSPDMASFPHHSFTQRNHLVFSLHLLSILLQTFSRMSLLLCISDSLSTGSSPSLTETSAKASHLASLSLASFLFTLFLSHHYCQI